MKVLIIGKDGQVGYELLRCLDGKGEVLAIGRELIDLASPTTIRDIIRSVKPQVVINAAAYTAVDKAELEPHLARQINEDAPAVMAQEARKLGALLVHYSTNYVFDGTSARPYREEDVPNPLNVYGRTKLAGEEAIRASEVSHVILRTGWVYGVRRKNFLLTVLQKAADQDQLQFVDDQHGSPTWSRTVAEATSQSLIQGWSHDLDGRWWEQRFGTYHLTSIGETTWFGFAQSIVETWPLTKRPAVFPICSREWPSAAARPHRGVLSCDKWINTFSDLPTWEDALEVCKREHIKYES